MADPVPVTAATMGGALTSAIMIAYAHMGTFRGLLQAYTNNADLVAAVGSGEMVLPMGRTIAGGSISIAPNTATANASPVAATITGTGFTPASVVTVDGVVVPSTFVSATSITTAVPRASAGAKAVGVRTGAIVHPTTTFTVT
jgi:hypothetical protein